MLNAAAQLLQVVVGIVVVPFLVRGMGADVFGAFQLVWVLLGYFALVDIGLGRATTRFVADAIGRRATLEIPEIVASAASLQAVMGVLGALVLAAASGPIVVRMLDAPAALEPAMISALRWMSIALPAVLLAPSYSGVLEAHQRFDLVNAIRLPSGVATLIAPLVALSAGAGLVGIVQSVVLVRYATVVAYYVLSNRVIGKEGRHRPSTAHFRALLGFGGWVTVSNVISPLMVYLDRFVIGARLGLEAVAHYTAPFDAIVRAAVLPSSLTSALFPAFSSLNAAGDRDQMQRIAASSARLLITIMTSLAVTIIIGAHAGLRIWLGPVFADAATPAVRIIAVGVLANALAQIPFAVLQSSGRADVTASLHLIELPLYGAALWFLTSRYGIAGAGLAWAGRCTLDAGLLYGAIRITLRRTLPLARAVVVGSVLPLALAIAIAAAGLSDPASLAAAALGAALSLLSAWRFVLSADDRASVLRQLQRYTTLPTS
ncbi:MAG TPA: flippase [Gemmatimonadaceae bacterium]